VSAMMHNRSYRPSSLAEEAPSPTQCKHTCRSERSLFVHGEIQDHRLAIPLAPHIHEQRHCRFHNKPCTLHNRSATAAARTATSLAGRRSLPHLSACHEKLQGTRGAPTLPREQRTRHYRCTGPDRGERSATPEMDEPGRQIFWRAHTVHNEDSFARLARRHLSTQIAHTSKYTRARFSRQHVRQSITKED
jgi:hypothetical protein